MRIPQGWQERRLDQWGTVVSGATPSTTVPAFWNGDIVWVTPSDLSRLTTPHLTDSSKKITEAGLSACSAQLLPRGSVVLSSRAPIGYVALPTVPFSMNQGCKALTFNDGIEPQFAYYNLVFNIDKVKTLGEGTTFAEISKTALSSIRLSFPVDQREQAKIADVLSTVDRAIEHTAALIAKQQRIKTGLMQDLLTRGIDCNGSVRSEARDTFKYCVLGRIPLEWEVRRLSEITTKIADRDHTTPEYVDDGVLMVSPVAFCDDEGIAFDACPRVTRQAHLANSRKTDCRAGDIILHRIGAGLGRVRVVAENHPEYSILHSLALVRPDSRVAETTFLKWAFRSFQSQKQMGLGTQSIGVPDLGLDKIGSLLFAVPQSVSEQKQIGRVLEQCQDLLNEQFKNLNKLRALKAGLMPDLLTGRKRVKPLLEAANQTLAQVS